MKQLVHLGELLINTNVTVKLSQYYDPAQPTKIKELVVTYSNGQKVGSTSYVRDIFKIYITP